MGQQKRVIRQRALLHALFFVLGFSVVFLALGLSAGLVGRMFMQYKDLVRQLGGLLMIGMGAFLAGLISPKWMYKQKKWNLQSRPVGFSAPY